jgi:hypothetical protein
MRNLLLGMTGAAMVLLAPSFANAAVPSAAPAAHSSIEQARMVKRCHTAKTWQAGPHGRHLITHRSCHMVQVH